MARATLARIFPEHMRHNAKCVRKLAPHSRVMACVKGNAYGHGINISSDALVDHVDGFAVASMEEALQVRKRHSEKPILLLEGPHSADEVAEARHRNLTLCIHEWHQIHWLEGSSDQSPVSCWLKIDTGMHRLGFAPSQLMEALERLKARAKLTELVLCTHFSSADLPGANCIDAQLGCFDDAVACADFAHSTANSAAIIRSTASHRDWVRPGYMLYGGSPLKDATAAELALKPAMEFSAEVIALRDIAQGEGVGYGGRWKAHRPSRVATIAAGYGDGYPRHARDGTPVLIEGELVPLAGRVSMDMITVDVSDHPAVRIGSRAVLWGGQPGIDEIAKCSDSIGYELLAGMPQRVPRQRRDTET